MRKHHTQVCWQVLDISLHIVKVSLHDLAADPLYQELESIIGFLGEHHRLKILEIYSSLLAYSRWFPFCII